MKNKKQMRDSITLVNSSEVSLRVDGKRVTVGFKCEKKLWDAFVSYSKENYGSVCHILEPVIRAILTAQVNQSTTIKPIVIENLVVERAVQRVRRYSREGVEVRRGTPEEMGMNYFEPSDGRWMRIDDVADSLNAQGHVIGCGCLLCRRR